MKNILQVMRFNLHKNHNLTINNLSIHFILLQCLHAYSVERDHVIAHFRHRAVAKQCLGSHLFILVYVVITCFN